MRTFFRCFGFGIVFLTMIVAAISCRKPTVQMQEKTEEPWPVVAIWAWGDPVSWREDDVPDLIIYSDGRIIIKKVEVGDRQKRTESNITYWTKVLPAYQLVEFESFVIGAINELPAEAIDVSHDHYDRAACTFYFGGKGKGFLTWVHGLTVSVEDGVLRSSAKDIHLPDSFFRYVTALSLLDLSELEPWKPTKLTVNFVDGWDGQPPQSVWPKDWPQPNAPGLKQSDGRIFIYLSSEKQGDIQRVLGTEQRDDFVNVSVAGHNYSAAFQYYFPCEEVWYEKSKIVVFDIMNLPPPRSRPRAPEKKNLVPQKVPIER